LVAKSDNLTLGESAIAEHALLDSP
jgi:hypothetical protein